MRGHCDTKHPTLLCAHLRSGQACKARTAIYRCSIRKETKERRNFPEDVSILVKLTIPKANKASTLSSAQSTLTNKSRLKLLQRREEHLQDLFSSARSSILELAKDEGRYTQFLEGIIVQGFLQLMEPNVTILSRSKDVDIVKSASEGAAKQYTEVSGREVKFEVDGSLPDDGCVTSLHLCPKTFSYCAQRRWNQTTQRLAADHD